MKLGALNNQVISPTELNRGLAASNKQVPDNQEPGFSDYLLKALGEVDHLQQEASSSARQLALGDSKFLHNTIIAHEKASLALQLTIEIRNKVVEAYQEIMRMQL